MAKPDSTPGPALVFVENSTERPIGMRHPARRDELVQLGPGLNVVTRELLDAVKPELGDPFDGAVHVVEVAQIPAHSAVALAAITASRQAMIAWRKVETRERVLEAIDARLAMKGPKAPQD